MFSERLGYWPIQITEDLVLWIDLMGCEVLDEYPLRLSLSLFSNL